MKPFTFRLATLLKLRESIRDDRRARLAQAFEAASVLQRRMDELEAERSELRARQAKANAPGNVVVEQLLEVQRYESIVASEQNTILKQQQQLEEEIEHRRQALTLADQEVRVLEKLRDKQRGTHKNQAEREETKEYDELANRRSAVARIESVASANGGDA